MLVPPSWAHNSNYIQQGEHVVSGVRKDANLSVSPARVQQDHWDNCAKCALLSSKGCRLLGYDVMTPPGVGNVLALGCLQLPGAWKRQKTFCDQDARLKELRRAGHKNLESANQYKWMPTPRLVVI